MDKIKIIKCETEGCNEDARKLDTIINKFMCDKCIENSLHDQDDFESFDFLENIATDDSERIIKLTIAKTINKNINGEFLNCWTTEAKKEAIDSVYNDLKHIWGDDYF